MTSPETVWIAGCGDIGRRLARLYQAEGRKVHGIARSETTCQAARAAGIDVVAACMDQPLPFDLTRMAGAALYYFAPPPPKGRRDTTLAAFLDQIGGAPRKIVLISTTGVYGDCDGAWIDESAPLKPVADRAWRRLDAERLVSQWARRHHRSQVILRVPGIYAPPERLPLQRIRQGAPVLNETESPFTNRIHADDLATICRAAMDDGPNGAVFNATDGHPCTMTEYFNRVADYAGLPRPPQISLAEARNQLSAGMLSYLAESRRIRNDRLLKQLGVTLRYPSLSDALARISHRIT